MRLRPGLPQVLPLLVLPLWVTTPLQAIAPTPRTTSDECRPEDRTELNVVAWKASLKRAETRERRDELLGEMKLSLDLGDSEATDDIDGHATGPITVALLAIDDFFAQLGAGNLPDHVVQVRYRIDKSDDKTMAYLIQVLRPLGGNRWCLLGADLSRQDGAENKLVTYALGFVPLLNRKTKAIEIQIVDAELRHSETSRQYWVAEGFKLRKIFDQKIASMENTDKSGVTTARSGKLALVGDFPKRIELSQVTKNVICDVGATDIPCDDGGQSSSVTFVYNGKSYVRRK